MARYTGPKCKVCRRLGAKLYLKGVRCESEKCTLNKKQHAPGQHGTVRRRRTRLSAYGVQLREKQKAKKIYGVLEKQFRTYVKDALKAKGVASEGLMQRLETRLDNMVYRGGFSVSRSQARQFIKSGFLMVNGKVVTIPSMRLKVGDVVKPVAFDKIHLREGFSLPDWLKANVKERYIEVARLPTAEDLSEPFDAQLIIEFFSR